MSEDTFDKENDLQGGEGHSDYKPADTKNKKVRIQTRGMYEDWLTDYA